MKLQTEPYGQPISLAIADDDALAREGLKSLLQTNPRLRIVGEASDRKGLIALVRNRRPDIVIIDADLLVSEGMQVITHLREEAPETKMILMGINTEPEMIIQSLQSGVAGYVQKSASVEQFEEACLQVAGGLQPVLPEVATDLLWYVLEQKPLRPVRDESRLTRRQYEVLYLMVQGLCNKEIANILNVSETTVKSHVTSILRKLGVADRTQAVVKAIREGIVAPGQSESGLADYL